MKSELTEEKVSSLGEKLEEKVEEKFEERKAEISSEKVCASKKKKIELHAPVLDLPEVKLVAPSSLPKISKKKKVQQEKAAPIVESTNKTEPEEQIFVDKPQEIRFPDVFIDQFQQRNFSDEKNVFRSKVEPRQNEKVKLRNQFFENFSSRSHSVREKPTSEIVERSERYFFPDVTRKLVDGQLFQCNSQRVEQSVNVAKTIVENALLIDVGLQGIHIVESEHRTLRKLLDEAKK